MAEALSAAETLRRPASAGEIFRVFNWLALQGFGGVLAVAQRELVERQRWLTRRQFLDLLAISQVLPGPNIVNLALTVGDRFLGWRGAAAALAGLMLVPLLIVIALAMLYGQWRHLPMVAGALRGMGAVAAGLIIATALKLVGSLRDNVLGWRGSALLALLTFVAVGVLRWPLIGVVLGLGSLAVALAFWRLAAVRAP
jgi:chromate transporter